MNNEKAWKAWSDEERILFDEYFSLGYSDKDIAAALGRTRNAVRNHRWSRGIDRTDEQVHDWSGVDWRLSNTEISKIVGCSRSSVSYQRKKLNKPSVHRNELLRLTVPYLKSISEKQPPLLNLIDVIEKKIGAM